MSCAPLRRAMILVMLGALTPLAADAATPRTHYLLYCSGCHLPDGSGRPPNVPSLHDEPGRMMQQPQMRSYLARVPGSAQAPIDDEELTRLLNWMLEEFSAATLPEGFKALTRDEVSAARAEILADPNAWRARWWKPYEFQTPLPEHR